MSEILELMHVDFGTFGNHDMDFGLDWLEAVRFFSSPLIEQQVTQNPVLFNNTKKSSTCWLMSNLFLPGTQTPLCKAQRKAVVTRGGIKIGFIGVCEDWVDSTVPGTTAMDHGDLFEVSESLARELKEQDGVDFVIAISHNRKKVDIEFSSMLSLITS